MSKYTTLRFNNEFQRVYRWGQSFVHPALVTYVMKNRGYGLRIGITTSKKIGKAVERNRAKRIITAAWRNLLPGVCGSYDIVFVARTLTTKLKSTDIERIMKRQLISAGAIKAENHEVSVD